MEEWRGGKVGQGYTGGGECRLETAVVTKELYFSLLLLLGYTPNTRTYSIGTHCYFSSKFNVDYDVYL
jgi:hypothetical protein